MSDNKMKEMDKNIKNIEFDKNIQSLIDKGFVMKVGDGFKLTPLGQALFGNMKNIKPNKLGGMMQKMQAGGEKLDNPELADLNKDGTLTKYEAKRGKAIENNMKKDKMNKRYGGKVRIPSNFGL